MYGLSVRWSLGQAPDGAGAALREYVTGTSLARFSAMDGLRFKTWRMRDGEWFEGTYVWATAAERDAFAEQFGATGADNPGSQLIGSAPSLIETFEVVAVAEGRAGFEPGPGPG
ncbi:hypothetical protein [Angustibacter luteus]|uniref:ABM domain-containing protein n=1 Tax=Angustibacter luteus TaxID=658456 RepID=A0ABW1JJC9_9ACTN